MRLLAKRGGDVGIDYAISCTDLTPFLSARMTVHDATNSGKGSKDHTQSLTEMQDLGQ
jgi:hypothetical protein